MLLQQVSQQTFQHVLMSPMEITQPDLTTQTLPEQLVAGKRYALITTRVESAQVLTCHKQDRTLVRHVSGISKELVPGLTANARV
jgi:hypothetical protein